MAEVVLETVAKTYPGGTVAVRGVDLHVADGEFVVLVGPSGCGKTTTLRMVAGLETPTSGTIRIGDRVVNDVHPKDRDVAMVFQDYALYPHMSVKKNLGFALKLRKVPKREIEERVTRTADMLGIGELLNRKPGALSGGQRQRVAVGRAIVRDPFVALFDEPLSNLDARLRAEMRAELKSLHQRLGTTTIYVTHDQEEAMTLGQRLVVMADGEVQQIGAPIDVYRRPANRFVAGFVGSPAMNFLEGRIERGQFHGSTDVRIPMPGVPDRTAVTVGIRPEHITPVFDGTITATVGVVEPLGDRMDVLATTANGERLTARVPIEAVCKPGDQLRFDAMPDRIHLFEPGPLGARIG